MNTTEGTNSTDLLGIPTTRTPLQNVVITGVIASFGIITNLIVFFTVIRSRTLWKPTYICIASLAISDSVFLTISILVFGHIGIIYGFTEQAMVSIDIIHDIGRIGSSYHLVLISTVRCYIMGYPLDARSNLSKKRTMLFCAGVHLFSITVGILNRVFVRYFPENLGLLYQLDAVVVYYALPLALLILFHSLKFKWFADMRKQFPRADTEDRRLLLVVILVLVMFAVLNLPLAIRTAFVINYSNSGRRQSKWTAPPGLRQIEAFMTTLNSALNPVVYAICSPRMRACALSLLRCLIFNHGMSCTKSNESP